MANIKISQLPSIGNGLTASTILPVVNTTGTLTTDKVAVGNIANFTLLQAGNTLPPAFVANVAYNVTNAAQPNITSVGNLTGLRINNIANFHIPGGTNGYVLQTDGAGNLSWTAQTGNSGNGSPGGSNSQLQFNLSGSFAGDPELTWDAGNNQLNTVNFAASSATIYGNVNAVNVNATGNVRPNAIYTDHYYYANGYAFGGGNGTPGGSNTQIQFNDAGSFAGNTGFTFNKTTGIFTSPFLAGNGNGLSNIQGANISGFVPNANVANTAFAVAGANVTGAVTYAGTANSVAVANVIGIGNIATLALDGSTSNVLYGNGVFAPSGSSSPAGSNTQIQFNNAGAFGSDANFSYNISTDTLFVPNIAGPANANLYVSSDNGNLTWIFGRGGALVWPGNGDHAIEPNIDEEFEIHSHNNVVISTDTANSNAHFTFDGEGKLNFNDGSAIGDVNGPNTFGIQTASNSSTVLITGDGSNTFTWNFGPNGNLTLPANTFAVNYANGSQVPLGTISSLVNGNNSFVLDSAGNVVFEGTPSGNAVDRGLVWDYGANANGVNSMIRQDLNGLTVRAWTENGGNYIAPVNIITGQDAATNTWRFDGQGNLTVPSGSINSINDGGDLGSYITLNPNLGLVKLASRDTPANVNYTNTSWISATYTGTQIDFVDAPDLVAFFTNNTFNAGVNQTISINGDEPVPFTGYTVGVSNAVTVYTSVTADPDPTTVTSIDFSSQLESYIAVDYDGGELVIGASGLTIMIDNDQTQGPDINIRSGDDILLQAKDKAIGTESEGGDINIYAGDGADDDGQGNIASTGGDIQITAGNGGDGNSGSGSAGGFTQIYGGTGGAAGVTNTAGPGGYVSINGGDGGYDTGNTQLGAGGGYVSINAGLSTQEGVDGPNVTITSGQGGPNALAGSVVISTPASVDGPGGNWVFDGYGNLILPNNSNIATIGNVTQFNTCSNGFLGLNSHDAGGNNIASIAINSIDGLVGISTYDPITDSDYHWAFDTTGNLTLPGNTFSVNYANGTPVSIGGGGGNTGNVTFDNVTVQGVNGLNLSAGADFTANLAYLQVRAGDVASHIHLDTGNNSAYDLIVGDDQNYVQVSSTGNILLSAYDSNTSQYTWTLDYNGNLILAGGNSVIQSIANSSLDVLNPNVSTMVLTPDPGYSSQALVLDPTSVGHIHLRSPGSNIDQPSANIFLGGETSSFEVGQYNGAVPNLFIHSNNYTWTFDIDGKLTFPGTPRIDTATNNFEVQAAEAINFEANTVVNIYTDAGNTTYQWQFGDDGNLIIPGTGGGFIKTISNASIGVAAMDNGTNNPAQLLSINAGSGAATSIVSAYSTNATIQTNATGTLNTWQFDNAGNLTLPTGGQIIVSGGLVSSGASPSPTINGFSISNSMGISGNGNISTTGTITSTGKIGYSTGGNATQTSTGQGVTINQLTGLVTLATRTYNAGDLEAFSISCNKVSNNDFVLVQMVDSVNAPSYNVVAYPNFVLANTISVLVKTLETVGTDTPILKFMIVKAPIA